MNPPLRPAEQTPEHPLSPAKKKFKCQPSAKKIILTVFRVMKHPILVRFQELGKTVNSSTYWTLLQNELKPAIRTKRRGMLTQTVLQHHDNARPHTTAAAVVTIQELGITLLPHTPHSTNLASNYHSFSLLKETLCSRRFISDAGAKDAMQTWLRC